MINLSLHITCYITCSECGYGLESRLMRVNYPEELVIEVEPCVACKTEAYKAGLERRASLFRKEITSLGK